MKHKILFILNLPPPVHGANIAGQYILQSNVINELFEADYINLTTEKKLNKIGGFSFQKIFIVIRLYARVFFSLISKRYDLCYMNINAKGNGFYKDFIVVILLKIFHRKIVYHYQNKGVSEGQGIWCLNLMYRFQFHNSNAILLSSLLYRDIAKYLPENNVFICANGVSRIEPMDIDVIRIKRTQKSIPEILFLSNMIKEKGVFVLMESARILTGRNVRFTIKFVGGWVDVSEKEFSNYIKENDLEDCVCYAGIKYGAEKSSFFENADIFVLPTFYNNEAFPLANLEAMQYGLPIVSTSEGAIPDAVVDNVNGYLVKRRDANDLAEKLQYLIENPEIRNKMGDASRRRFEAYFTREIFEKNLTKIFKNIIQKQSLNY